MAIRRWPALAVAAAVFLTAALALGLSQSASLPLARAKAVRAAVDSPSMAGTRWTATTVTAIDSTQDRVSFFDGGQIVAQVAVNRGGKVTDRETFTDRSVPYGDWIAYEPALLIGLAALFVLMTAVTPWRRLRNLDVGAALSLVAPMVLLQHRYVDASVLAAVPGLAYLMVRCAVRGLGAPPEPGPSVPLFDALTDGWGAARRIRVLRLALFSLALVVVMVTVSSRGAVDVTYAVMEGATKLLGGVLPYGHMPGDVMHGDTYPLLSFALYTPLAWVSPVRSTWSSVDLALGLAAVAALVVAWALFRMAPPGRRLSRSPDREAVGLRAALSWLSFPPLLAVTSTGTTDVVLAVMLLFAVALWRRPGLAAGLLAAGAWFKLVPLALLPARLAPLRGRQLVRALAAVVLVSLPMVSLLLALGGSGGPAAMVHAISYQFSRGSPQSVWSALGIESLQPVGQAAALALIAGAAVALGRRAGDTHTQQARMAALCAAILIALQLAANYWAFLYLAWFMPLVTVSLLTDPAPVPAAAGAAVPSRPSARPELVGAG